jgi:hypothetical protein
LAINNHWQSFLQSYTNLTVSIHFTLRRYEKRECCYSPHGAMANEQSPYRLVLLIQYHSFTSFLPFCLSFLSKRLCGIPLSTASLGIFLDHVFFEKFQTFSLRCPPPDLADRLSSHSRCSSTTSKQHRLDRMGRQCLQQSLGLDKYSDQLINHQRSRIALQARLSSRRQCNSSRAQQHSILPNQ